MNTQLRSARREDIPGMHRVRLSVRENRLVNTRVTEDDYIDAIESWGRGWVIEAEGVILAFAVGDARSGGVWALFVEPSHEGRGFGRRLHDEMVNWFWNEGHEQLWLTTDPGTRAQRFYEAAGWKVVGTAAHGEARLELYRPHSAHT